MHLLEKKLSENTTTPHSIPVWFNPWRYEEEEHLIIPFLKTIAHEIGKYKITNKRIRRKLSNKRLKEISAKIGEISEAFAYGIQEDSKLGGAGIELDASRMAGNKALIKRHIKKAKSISERLSSVYYEIAHELESAVGMKSIRIVVFIDDLDRCLPDQAVEFLKVIKLFLDIEGYLFVLGIDRDVMGKGSLRISPEDYLDRMIQLPLELPPIEPGRKRRFIESLMCDTDGFKEHSDIIEVGAGDNPRMLKRFINLLSFTVRLAETLKEDILNDKVEPKESEAHKALLQEYFIPLLYIKWAIIVFRYPEIHNDIKDDRKRLIELQNAAMEEEGDEDEETEIDERLKKVLAKGKGFPDDDWLIDRFIHLTESSVTVASEEEEEKEEEKVAEEEIAEEEEVITEKKQAKKEEKKEPEPEQKEEIEEEEEEEEKEAEEEEATEEKEEEKEQKEEEEEIEEQEQEEEEEEATEETEEEIEKQEQEEEQEGEKEEEHEQESEKKEEVVEKQEETEQKEEEEKEEEEEQEKEEESEEVKDTADTQVHIQQHKPGDMVLVPKGKFLYGEDKEEKDIGYDYYIDVFPVTNKQYKEFVDDTNREIPFRDEDWAEAYSWDPKSRTYNKGVDNHPVVLVSYNDAEEFCKWRSAKEGGDYRLPTEEEWEKAARGTDGREYPWGNDFDYKMLNCADYHVGKTLKDYDEWAEEFEDDFYKNNKNKALTAECGRFTEGVSPYGCLDMAGNVWEWTDSIYEDQETEKVMRGGSWNFESYYCRCTDRDGSNADNTTINVGFRCVRNKELEARPE
jgi:formylglycine-generating enzyme required for sulfatase activity